ncbi:MAG: AMP-dependent synthetase/ligase [Chthoniobacterales bacterium]
MKLSVINNEQAGTQNPKLICQLSTASCTTSPSNLAEMFLEAGRHWGLHPAFATRTSGGKFHPISYASWCERSLALATALIEIGIEARDHVGLFSDNCLSWIVADAAIQFCGAADVPRGSDITTAEIAYILSHADVKILFLENAALLEKLRSKSNQLPQLSHVIMMESDPKQEAVSLGDHFHVLSLETLERHGQELRASGNRRVEERVKKIQPDDLFTLIYTSGTTGIPKGVQLTHAAICSQIKNLPLDFSEKERALSILPIWHSYERVFEMVIINRGGCTYYTSPRHLSHDFQKVKPTVMASAPRLWEALYEKIIATITKQSFFKKNLFYAALTSAHHVRTAKEFFQGQVLNVRRRNLIQFILLAMGHALKWFVAIMPFLLLNRLLLKKIQTLVGGSLKATISGGGALPPYIDKFFNDCGIPVLEGYGLTETTAVLTVRNPKHLVLDTVGPPLPGTEICIVDLTTGKTLYPDAARSDLGCGLSGEICARGPQIMKGYYKDAEGTERVLCKGWLRTGDIGLMTLNGSLKIIGRCKETIVLLNGENVEPLPIESRLLQSPLIAQCIVIGQDQKHLGALIVPSLAGLAERGIIALSLAEILHDSKKITPLLHDEIRRLVSSEHGFKPFEKISCWRLLEKPFEVGDELTPTYKLKRHVITEKYAPLLRELFKSNKEQ